jgi:hypothetical protein
MANFTVTYRNRVSGWVHSTVDVEAEDETDALTIANQKFDDANPPYDHSSFTTTVEEGNA